MYIYIYIYLYSFSVSHILMTENAKKNLTPNSDKV